MFRAASFGAGVALIANLLDVGIGFGEPDVSVPGSRTATEWFTIFGASAWRGIYLLGALNLVYMLAMLVVYAGIVVAHDAGRRLAPAFVVGIAFTATAIYVSNNSAIPMLVLSARHHAASPDDQPAYVAAAEAVLARGEDFTPGAFGGLALSGLAALLMSIVMLNGQVFSRLIGWIGLAGFSLLLIFTVWATFVPFGYAVAFYGFGLVGGLLALAWFGLVARAFASFASHRGGRQ